ncbi:MAG: HAMP domain-containing protein [Candidatus Zixiibacteriota bacterium]|nr:MAG: HAMP domain-containing protein [candidate division Zixibacteria bacterium]
MSLFGSIKRFGLREKFVVVVSLVIVASMLIISGYLIKRQNEIYRTELEKRGRELVANLAYNAEYGVILESNEELDNLIKGVARANDIIYVVIKDNNGRVLAETGGNLLDGARKKRTSEKSNATLGKFQRTIYASTEGVEFIELTHPVETVRQSISRENLGTVYGYPDEKDAYSTEIIGEVGVCLTFSNLNREITKSQTASILLTFMVVLSAIILMTAFVKVITRPIESLVRVTDQISKGDLSRTVDIVRSDEIGRLAESFNRMIESLKRSQEEIEEYNRTLEEKIIERTKELEEAQAQLIQSEKMVAIGQLAAGVAHELNNPLGGILGYAQFTLEKIQNKSAGDISEKDIESYKRYLRDIEAQSRRCKSIVQNLLKFSRTSQAVDFSEIDINAVVEDTLTFVEHQLMMSQIRLNTNLETELPKIKGNPSQLQQVFTNIILNAMHASEPGKQITLTSRLAPPLGEFHGAVEIVFRDEGKGICEEHLPKIFEPFFTTKDIGKGTGLGLSVSYGIVKEHGGEIKVKSKLGEGTVFTVIIPLEKSPSPADKLM